MRPFKAIAVTGVAMLLLSACGQTEVTGDDIARNLIDMTVAEEEKEPATEAEFCKDIIQSYGDYGVAVSDRAVIQSKAGTGDYSAEDIYKNVNDQQDAIQNLENQTKKYTVTDNDLLEQARTDFLPYSEATIKAYKDAKENESLENIDSSIVEWERFAQPVVLICMGE